ncbi:hypothetical protein FV219_24050 [Methylobacterium sp. WL122]|nr:hypothetical protein FV219_24050 [Methylobacterium sp. WL122]
MSAQPLRLGVNIDHVATVRNARGGAYPDPVKAAHLAVEAGADGITAHLREDRRHIRDADMEALARTLTVPLNFEMAATDEMVALALKLKPHAACLVPEKREERTTEGGLDIALAASPGSIARQQFFSYPERRTVRVAFELDPGSERASELRLALVRAGRPVTETWLYRWTS